MRMYLFTLAEHLHDQIFAYKFAQPDSFLPKNFLIPGAKNTVGAKNQYTRRAPL
jgi:hypothetical protein